MRKIKLLLISTYIITNISIVNAQEDIYTGVFKTTTDNTDYHHFTRSHAEGAAVYINQVSTGPILKLSSGIFDANQNVKLTVENNGYVGIGTTSPDDKLEINEGHLRITHTGAPRMMLNENNTAYWRTLVDGGNIRFDYDIKSDFSTYSTKFKILSDGNVGIGTSTPNSPLEINSEKLDSDVILARFIHRGNSIEAGAGIQLGGVNDDRGFGVKIFGYSNPYSNYNSRMSIYTSSGQNSWNLGLTQDNGGNVGIGTTSPLGKVDILVATDEVALRLSMPTSEDAAAYDIKWANSNADVVHRIQYSNTYYDFMNVNRASRNVSFNGGNVGIGITTPKSKLDFGTNYSDPSIYPNKITLWANGENNYFGFGISSGDLDYFSQGDHRFYTEYNGTPGTEKFTILSNGNVGIGATSPSARIDVKTDDSHIARFLYDGDDSRPRLNVWGSANKINLRTTYNTGGADLSFGTTTVNDALIIKQNGNVGIGTISPPYKLTVEGTIGAREVIVTSDVWADFVFEPTYNLMPLKDLDNYIQENKHLPEMPTTEEVSENGISVGEMNAKLLQKIEELTLYTIQQQVLINNQQELIGTLKQGFEAQNSEINKLKELIK